MALVYIRYKGQSLAYQEGQQGTAYGRGENRKGRHNIGRLASWYGIGSLDLLDTRKAAEK